MGYLGIQSDALDARVAENCKCVPGCDCGGCTSGCAYAPHLPPPNTLAHAYYTGGSGDNLLTAATDGLNFPTGIMSVLPSANLSLARWTHLALSDGITCRFAGGAWRDGSTTGLPNEYTTVVDKVVLATDTSSVDGPLVSERTSGMGVGNQTRGFAIGGFGNSFITLAAEAFDYATGLFSLLSGALQTQATVGGSDFVYEAGEVSNDTQGYLMGGFDWSDNTRRRSVDVVTFATDSVALADSVSSLARSDIAAAGNATVGLFIGGDTSVFPTSEITLTDVVEKITYATDTLASAGNASLKVMDASATGNSTHAYFSGGYLGDVSAAWLAGTSRVEYATDTEVAVDSATLKSGARSSMEAAGSSYF